MIRCRFVFIFVYNISLEPEYTLLQAAVAFDLRLRKFTVHATHMRLPSMATKLAAKGLIVIVSLCNFSHPVLYCGEYGQ
jgi:hypothetical protein